MWAWPDGAGRKTRNRCLAQSGRELGCNFFDTAWAMAATQRKAAGKSSARAFRQGLYAATKIPPQNRKWPSRREFKLDDCYPPNYIAEFVDTSLGNIGVETLDLIPVSHLGRQLAGRRTLAARDRETPRER